MKVFKWLIFTFVIAFLFFFRIELLTFYGKLFVKNDLIVPDKTPVVLLGGNIVVRAGYASTVYTNLNSDEFIFFQQPEIDNDFFKQYILSETLLTEKILKEKFNINEYRILSYGRKPVTSTYEEAKALNEFLLKNNIKQVVLITDGFHSYRAYKIFSDIIKKTKIYVKIISVKGQRYDDWWTSEQGIKYYLLELVKFINYYINRG